MVILAAAKACLKAIEEGRFDTIDFSEFVKIVKEDPVKLGDHLQCSLHKFCKKNENPEVEPYVVELSQLCFTKESVSGFTNMDRFLGSLLYITMYFLKREKYFLPIEIIKTIEFKKKEIEKSAEINESTRNFIQILHTNFMSAAQDMTSKINGIVENQTIQESQDLALCSVKFLMLIKSEQYELGRKLFRNAKIYFSSISFYDNEKMLELYNCVESALGHFLPSYEKNDFLLYYISKMDQIGSITEGPELKNHFEKHVNMVTTLMNDSETGKYWKVILDFFFGTIKRDTCCNDLKDAITAIINYKGNKLHILVLAVIFNHAHQLWMRTYVEDWCESISAEFASFLYKEMLIPMRKHLGNVSNFCRTSKYNLEICLGDFLTANFIRMLHFMRACMRNTWEEKGDLIKLFREAVENTKEILGEMKNECCMPRKTFCWNHLVIHWTNTIGTLSVRSTTDEEFMETREYCRGLLTEIMCSDSSLSSLWDEDRNATLFQRWHYANMKLKDFEEALFCCALFIVSCPKSEDDAFSQWVSTKLTILAEDSQAMFLSFKDIIDREGERMKTVNSKFEPGEYDTKKLLMLELSGYGSSPWTVMAKSTVAKEAIKKLWNELKVYHLNPWEKAVSLNYVVAAAISCADYPALESYRKDSEAILQNMLSSKLAEGEVRKLFYAGQLKFTLFICTLKSVQNLEEKVGRTRQILAHLKKLQVERAKFGEIIDLNISCEVMPSSRHFSVLVEEGYITSLKEVLLLWQEAAKITVPDCMEKQEFDAWLLNTKQLAQTFNILGDMHHSFITWILYYQICKICNNRPGLLIGLSNIMSECSDVEGTNLEKKGDEIAEELIKENKNHEVVIAYWLASVSHHLKNKREDKCLALLLKVQDTIECVKTARKFLHQAKFWSLVSKFLCMFNNHAEKFGTKTGGELKTIVFRSFNYVHAFVHADSLRMIGPGEHCELILTMIDVNIWAVRFFGAYYQATYMRLFLQDLYRMFQQLVFPSRTAEVLSLLLQIDIMCERVEDATVKLESLKLILEMQQMEETVEEDDEMMLVKKMGNLTVPKAHEDDMSLSPRVLSPSRFADQIDTSKENGEASPMRLDLAGGSSVKGKKNYNHPSKCTCYPCRNLLIRTLRVRALSLEAQLNKLKSCDKKSYLCHRESYKNRKKVEFCRIEQNKELENLLSLSLPELEVRELKFHDETVKISAVEGFIYYTVFLLSSSLKEDLTSEAEKLLMKVDKELATLSYYEKIFQWVVLELKLMSFVLSQKYQKDDKNAVQVEEKATTSKECPRRSPYLLRTPYVSKVPAPNPVRVRLKGTSHAPSSPNGFVSKPKGRKILYEDCQSETSAASLDSSSVIPDTPPPEPKTKRKAKKEEQEVENPRKKKKVVKQQSNRVKTRSRRRGLLVDSNTGSS